MAALIGKFISRTFIQQNSLLRLAFSPCYAAVRNNTTYEWSECQGPFKKPRSLKPRRYWQKKKAAPTPELTGDNEHFLQEVVRDTYEHVVTDSLSPLKQEVWPRQDWTLLPVTKRAGVIGMKLGMMPQWTKEGKRIFVTLVQVLDNHVIRYHTPEQTQLLENSNKRSRSQFGSMIIGALSCDPTRLSKQYVNLFAEAGVPPKRKIAKFYVSPNAAMAPGTPITIKHFRVGEYVDVYSRSIGRGFQGVVRRWGFAGGPATHGTTKWHRRPGSLSGGDSSKVWPGTKLPGHMGSRPVNMRGLKIWRIDYRYNVLYLHGTGVAGPTGAYVKIRDTVLVPHRQKLEASPPPMPTWYPEDETSESVSDEVFADDLHNFMDDSIIHLEEKS